MATAAISIVAVKLGAYLILEANKLTGIHKHVTELQSELERLQSFVRDADAKQHKSERLRNCVLEIRELVYDAENVIETFILEKAPSSEEGIKRSIKNCLSILTRPLALWRVGSEIEEITTRLSKLRESMLDFGIRQIMDSGDSSPSQANQWEVRQSFPQITESNLVGLEQNIEELVTRLMEKERRFRVLSIGGMGGLGKTTLAKQVFHHGKIRGLFNRFAWVCVSRQCRRRYVWQEILLNLSRKEERARILDMRDEQLQHELYEFLQTHKCLVVLDDIWSTEAWDLIKHVFPARTDSKILLTSRYENVAAHTDPSGIIFKPKCLSQAQSWELFQKIAFCGRDRSEIKIDEGIAELGYEMVEKCGGLPLAVIVLGGLLASKNTLNQWKRVYKDFKSYKLRGIGSEHGNSPVFRVLSLSYEDLPSHLKQCFLYLAHFPEDYEIDAERLIYYWIAEGMILPRRNQWNDLETTVRDVAEGYLEELVKRSLVLVERTSFATSRIERCRMHDVMRDVCLWKAEQENFLQVVSLHDQTSDVRALSYLPTAKSHRLVINCVHKGDHERSRFCCRQIRGPKARTLLYNTKGLSNHWVLSDRILRDLRLLRVLDFSGAKFEGGKLSKDIGKLIHLRYLNLSSSNLSELPSSVGNLKLLVYLDLEIYETTVHVPNILNKMQELRYLVLPIELSNKTKLELSNLVNLETLGNFSVKNSDVRDLFNMVNLRRLGICIPSRCREEVLTPSLSAALKHLELFVLSKKQHDWQPTKIDVAKLLSGFEHLNELGLDIKMEKLPDECQFPAGITSIFLENCELPEDPMPIVEKLHNLKQVIIDSSAFVGRKMVCSKTGFPQLHSLELKELDNLRKWIIEKGSMPRLCQLEVNKCKKLRGVPDGLKYITTLKELKIVRMKTAFKEKLVQGGKDYYKVQHIPSVVLE